MWQRGHFKRRLLNQRLVNATRAIHCAHFTFEENWSSLFLKRMLKVVSDP